MKLKKLPDETVKLIAGIILAIGSTLGTISTFLGVVDLSLTRKILLGSITLIALLSLELAARRRKNKPKNRSAWILDLIVAVFNEAKSDDDKKVLQEELFVRITRWALVGLMLVILLAGIFSSLENILNPIITPPTLTPTPTQTPTQTQTLTITPSPTITLTPSPVPESLSHYYMIVLDASVNMQESFDGQSKWGAALTAVSSMLEALNRNSNYGLVVVGGSSANSGTDPCGEPSVPIIPFVTNEQVLFPRDTFQMEDLITQINQLQPVGGGSLYTAFSLAKRQLDDLPAGTVKSLIFITGSNDSCESRDEWRELERIVQLPDLVGLYSEIIVIDESVGLDTRNIMEHISSLSSGVNVQISQSYEQLQQDVGHAIDQVNTHVEEQQAALDSNVQANPVIVPTSTPQVIVNASPPNPTAVPPTQVPPTPIPPTLIPQATNTPLPSVVLLSASYLGSGEGCSALITFQVSGSLATGNFHVWNPFYDAAGDVYPQITLPVGTNGYQVGLGGHPAEYYRHEVWFEYNGTSSNRLTNLVCPGLTPSP
jgi:hypothetical protein